MSDNPLISKQDQSSPTDLNTSSVTIRGPEGPGEVVDENSKVTSPSTPKGAEDAQLQLAIRAHTYITEYIKLSDQKAGFLFAISTGLLALMHQNTAQKHFIKPLSTWSFVDAIYFVACATLLISAGLSFMVIKPRTKIKKPSGLIFWQTVSAFDSAQDYISKTMSLSKTEVISEIFDHHYRLSKTCDSKYDNLNAAIVVGAFGISLSILLLIL